jgi:hypothetical protein
MELQKPNKLKPEQQTQLYPHKTGTFRFFASTMYAGKRRFNACARGNKSVAGLLHFCTLFRGSAIGSTPAFGAGYPGSSPGPGAICFVLRTESAGSFYSRAGKFSKRNPTIARLPKPGAAWVGAQLSVRWDALL